MKDNINALGNYSPQCLCDTYCNADGRYVCASREENTTVFNMINKEKSRNNSVFYLSANLQCTFEV